MAEEIVEAKVETQPAQNSNVHSGMSIFSPELAAKLNGATPAKTEVPVVKTETKVETPVEKPVVETKVETTEEKVETPAYKSNFGFDKKKDTTKETIKIENPDQLLEVIKSKYGQELKSISEVPKFLESVDKFRNDSQKLSASEKELQQYKDLYNNMPESFIEGLKLHVAGQDFMSAFNKPKIDYNSDPSKKDKFELVNHYFPGKFSKEDFETKDGEELPVTTQAIIEAATDKFNTEKKSIADKRVAINQEASQKLEAFKSSVSNSVTSMKTKFPDAPQENLANVETITSGGVSKVLGLFFKPDGTLKESAAEDLMWMMYGKDEVKSLLEITARKAETKTNEDLLTRGADTKKAVQGNGAVETLPKDLEQLFAGMKQLKEKKVF